MKSVDVKSNTYLDSSKKNNEKGPKFKIDHIVRISKDKKIFLKKITLHIDLKKFLWLKMLKTLFRGAKIYLIMQQEQNLKMHKVLILRILLKILI